MKNPVIAPGPFFTNAGGAKRRGGPGFFQVSGVANTTRVRPLVTGLVLLLVFLPALIASFELPFDYTGAAVFAGWLGTGLLSMSLLLMVREPLAARAFGGLERMYRWHHALGTLGYVALLAHPLLFALPHLPAEAALAWRVLSASSQNTAGGLGWLALLGLMAGLAGTFAMRMRYSLWRPLHALLALGVVLGIAHVLAIRPYSTSAWLVIVPAAAALAWRWLRADCGLCARPYEVSSVSHPARDVTEIRLRPLGAPLDTVTPGQFALIAFFEGPHFRGCGEYHPFTITGDAADGSLSFSVKALGDCTRGMQALEPGVAARVQGPYGIFLADRSQAPQLWIAGGIGIAPFLAALRAGGLQHPTTLIYAYRAEAEAAYLDELRCIAAREPLLDFHPIAARDDLTPIYARLKSLAALGARQVHLCGPPAMTAVLARALRDLGVGDADIQIERYDLR